jgi:hypothetical protein
MLAFQQYHAFIVCRHARHHTRPGLIGSLLFAISTVMFMADRLIRKLRSPLGRVYLSLERCQVHRACRMRNLTIGTRECSVRFHVDYQ